MNGCRELQQHPPEIIVLLDHVVAYKLDKILLWNRGKEANTIKIKLIVTKQLNIFKSHELRNAHISHTEYNKNYHSCKPNNLYFKKREKKQKQKQKQKQNKKQEQNQTKLLQG